MIKVLFLILNYKSYLDTIRVTDELLEAKRRDSKIIIVDNASPNESFQKISEAFSENDLVDVIQSRENGGYAKGNNYGLRYAKNMLQSMFVLLIMMFIFHGTQWMH